MEPDRNDYPSNSKEPREEPDDRPRKRKVIEGGAVERKKPLTRRIAETFTGDDAQTVGDYILFDIIIPAAKSMMSDAVSQGVERMLFGTSSYRPRGSSSSSYSYGNRSQGSSYTNRYRQQREREDPRERRREERASRQTDFLDGEVIVETRTDAEVLLDTMREALSQFKAVSVADVDDWLGITEDDWMRRAWGWTDLEGVTIRRLRADQYLLELPRPVKL